MTRNVDQSNRVDFENPSRAQTGSGLLVTQADRAGLNQLHVKNSPDRQLEQGRSSNSNTILCFQNTATDFD